MIFIIKTKIIRGIGDWGLGIGDWGLGIGPNPQSPIPNPQSPIPIFLVFYLNRFNSINFNYLKLFFKYEYKNRKNKTITILFPSKIYHYYFFKRKMIH